MSDIKVLSCVFILLRFKQVAFHALPLSKYPLSDIYSGGVFSESSVKGDK